MEEGLRVLVAEDEAPIAMGLSRQLTHLGHRVVAQAVDGQQAVELAAAQEIDLAVLDIRMPRLDGIEAARRINDIRPTPVILVTAYCEESLIQRAVEADVYAYLTKPIRADELRSAIAVASGRFAEQRLLADEVGHLQLTLEQRKLIERAKGIIMDRLGIDEEAAYRRLRTESQNTRRPMAEIATALIDAAHDVPGEPHGAAGPGASMQSAGASAGS